MECYLHVGMHKTGSTTIQKLMQKGGLDSLYYPNLVPSGNHSVFLRTTFSSPSEALSFNKKKGNYLGKDIDFMKSLQMKNVAILKSEIENCPEKKVVFSAEDLTSPDSNLFIESFADFLFHNFDKVFVVGYVRSVEGFINSSFQEIVKGGRAAFTLNKLYPNYRKRFQNIFDIFGENSVFLKSFEDELDKHVDIANSFLKIVGSENCIGVKKKDNSSVSCEGICLLYMYAKWSSRNVFMERKRGVVRNEIQNVVKKIGGEPFSFSSSLIKELVEKNQHDVEWMEAKLGMSVSSLREASNNGIKSEEDIVNIARRNVGVFIENLRTQSSDDEAYVGELISFSINRHVDTFLK